MVNREALLEDGRLIRHELLDTAAIDTECEEMLQEMDVVAGIIQKCVNENAVQTIDQDDYISRYNALGGTARKGTKPLRQLTEKA